VHGTYTKKITCQECNGAGLLPEYLAVTLQGKNIFQLSELSVEELESITHSILLPAGTLSIIETSLEVINKRLRFLRQVGIGYLHMNRPTGTLSAGEAQRIQLASLLGSGLIALTILVDEPSRGMHPVELEALRDALLELRDEGNSVIMIEHDPLLIRAADHIIDIGPGAGVAGGKIVAQGNLATIVESGSVTGKWLQTEEIFPRGNRRHPDQWMIVRGARENNLRGDDFAFPLGTLTGICGVSGSGKSTLVIDTIGRELVPKLHSTSFAQEPIVPGDHDGIENHPRRAFLVDQGRQGISSPANYMGLERGLISIYADSDDARSFGLSRDTLSERCAVCRGQGVIRMNMDFLPDEWLECETCQGTGYRQEAWDVRIRGVSLPEVNALTIDEIYQLLKDETRFAARLNILRQVGLGYLVWKQAAYTLSGGEVQRLKIARELAKKTSVKTLYILDEPTVGLHLEDVARLVNVLNRLVDAGHTVLTVEHHPHLLSACDWLIELGPVGGPFGGKIIATGPPEEVMKLNTPTAPYLRNILV